MFAPFLQTYLIDVYTAFCSDVMKLRNFHIDVMNLTTIDVLWDVSTLDVPCLVWHTFGAYNVVIIITYISAWASRCQFRHQGNAKTSSRGTTTVEFHVFFVPFCKQLNINVKPLSMETKQLNTNNIQSINDCIRRMLAEEKDLKALSSNTAFGNNIEIIKRIFRPCPCPTCPHQFSKMDIYHRLILIDSLYSTNINRMRSFGLEEMTDTIWDLCDDGNGNHSNAHLAQSLSYLIMLQNQQNVTPLINAFNDEYGYINGSKAGKAISLLSKYFYFVALIQQVDDYGFPIYDRIVRNLIRPIEKYMGLTPLSTDLDNIEKFIVAIKRIVDTLENADPNLWDPQNSGKLKFELLDYFLWHIGKAGEQSYRLLFTQKEYANYYNSNQTNLPKRIQDWENMYNQIKP